MPTAFYPVDVKLLMRFQSVPVGHFGPAFERRLAPVAINSANVNGVALGETLGVNQVIANNLILPSIVCGGEASVGTESTQEVLRGIVCVSS
jgi:hypothetical protein